MQNLHSESIDRLFKAMKTLETQEEYYAFFEDICTIKELQDIAQRFDTAILLDKGENYQNISKSVGISTATIGRVRKCLNYGRGGYRLALDRLKKEGEI